jgi:hypothetical protein
MLKPLQLHTPRLLLRPATAQGLESLQRQWPNAGLPHWRVEAQDAGLWVMAPLLYKGRGQPFEPLLVLRSEHRGQGYAQEAMRAVL